MPFRMLRPPLSTTSGPVELEIQTLCVSRRTWSKMPIPSRVVHVLVVFLLVAGTAMLRSGNAKVTVTTEEACASHDLPNSIATIFPNNATGVLNATLVIVPISLDDARRLIPAQYGILEHAYRSLLPDFPEGMYPMLVQAAHDHDIQLQAYGITLEDFSRVGLEFPFLDLLGDGHSSFRWAPAQLITADHWIAIQGSRDYGTEVSPASFEPVCDAYHHAKGENRYFKATSLSRYAELEMAELPVSISGLYPLALYKNITNQPTFANGSTCDNMIRLFNTSMTTGAYKPVQVEGRVRASLCPWPGEVEWDGVHGIQVATPFIENNYLDCRTMQGYAGTGGSGDSSMYSTDRTNEDL